MIQIVYGIENCENSIEPTDIPCQIVSTWNYTPPCTSYTATVFNNSGNNIINYTFSDYGDSGLCYFDWNVSTGGSYSFTVNNGDSGEVLVRYANMLLGVTIGIGIVIALFIFLAFKLDSSHTILRLALIFFSVILITIIPSVFIIDDFTIIFNKVIMGFAIVFWLYVAGYLVYWGYGKVIGTVPK